MSDLELTMMRRVGELNKEVARLKAEVERLKKFNDEAMAHIAKEERKSRERLEIAEAEVERLTKAGNNLVYVVTDHPVAEAFVKAWFAAKEGKPRA